MAKVSKVSKVSRSVFFRNNTFVLEQGKVFKFEPLIKAYPMFFEDEEKEEKEEKVLEIIDEVKDPQEELLLDESSNVKVQKSE